MERNTFRSNPFLGLVPGLIRGFVFGNLILLLGLALGMDDDMYIPLLGAAVILGGIIGIICCIGKKIEADQKGIYFKKKAYLFEENEMFMRLSLHYYWVIPVTEKVLMISGKDAKHKVKCSFLGRHDTGRLAKIIEDAMRSKHRTVYDDFEPNGPAVKSFIIPAADLAGKIHGHIRLHVRIMFIFLTVLFSWILISMIVQDQLEEHWLGLLLYMAVCVLILGGVVLFISRKFKGASQNIPCEVMFFGGQCYIDGRSFGGSDIKRVSMTALQNTGKDAMRKLVFYEGNGKITEYSFGFKVGKNIYSEYGELLEAVKDCFADKFAYDFN